MQTSLTAMEQSILKYENLLEECQMLEEEACKDQPDPGEDVTDAEMVDQEDRGNPEPSDPHMEAEAEDNPQPASGENTVSLEEEAILLGACPSSWSTAPGTRPCRSQDEWLTYGLSPQPTLGSERRRLHHESLRTSPNFEVLCLSSLASQKTKERSLRLERSQEEHEKTGVGPRTETTPANN